MKGFFKIICRYSFTAGIIIFAVLIGNVGAFIYWGYRTMESGTQHDFDRQIVDEIGEELYKEGGTWKITENGLTQIENLECQWLMALDDKGAVVWEWQLPDGFERSYSIQDVAVFTRWYLHDYPVAVWRTGDLLLVVGLNQDVFMRVSEIFPISNIEEIPAYLSLALKVNVAVILFFVLLLGYRLYTALKPIGAGIERLSRQEPLNLREKGMAGDLARQMNKTSMILQEQKKKLEKRDQARTEWIAGVSHDIRTPLALIMGYSDRLKKNGSLAEEDRRAVEIICRQSMIIRQLIEDLNLTSKLAYQAQPLKKEACYPSELLRECAADIYNEEFSLENPTENPALDIELSIMPEMEKARILADAGLIKRALRNLIGNSVRHNPGGCQIMVRLYKKNTDICYQIADTGKGIPEAVVKNMDKQTEKIHIMGLRLARQIARAHGGDLIFRRRSSGTCDVEIILPEEL